MPFLAREWRVSSYLSVDIASEDMFDNSGASDVFGFTVGQLYPVVLQMVANIEYVKVDSRAAGLNFTCLLMSRGLLTVYNPIIHLGSVYLSRKSEFFCRTNCC